MDPLHAFLAGAALSAVVVAALLFRRSAVIRQRALDGSRRALKGQAAETLAPLAPAFRFLPADARFLGHPVDYVVFDGYGDGDDVEIVLVEVKSGSSRLTEGERRVQEAVEQGRVRFQVLRL